MERTALGQAGAATLPAGSLGAFIAAARTSGELVVQPRMGFGEVRRMRRGLVATRNAPATTIGTITLDSYTRTGDLAAAAKAIREGAALNGYPLLTHDIAATREMVRGVRQDDFPVQVRHGSARPQAIIEAMLAAGLDATEGGPVSYCLPYSRLSLRESVANWTTACRRLAAHRSERVEPHIETFGGCLMGQLCPPGLLVAMSILEGMFFVQNGLLSVSLSYAQQTSAEQDLAALAALRRLAGQWLPRVDWHIVVYTYMGLFPHTPDGARRLLARSARLAVRSGAARLIVKTASESARIPSIEENVSALALAARAARDEAVAGEPALADDENPVLAEASALIGTVAALDDDVGRAILKAFARGYLDVPYCLHPDNANRARAHIDDTGRLRWSSVGSMPITGPAGAGDGSRHTSSAELLRSLSYVARCHDDERPLIRGTGHHSTQRPPLDEVGDLTCPTGIRPARRRTSTPGST